MRDGNRKRALLAYLRQRESALRKQRVAVNPFRNSRAVPGIPGYAKREGERHEAQAHRGSQRAAACSSEARVPACPCHAQRDRLGGALLCCATLSAKLLRQNRAPQNPVWQHSKVPMYPSPGTRPNIIRSYTRHTCPAVGTPHRVPLSHPLSGTRVPKVRLCILGIPVLESNLLCVLNTRGARTQTPIDSSGWDPSKKGTDLAAGICAALRPVHKNHVSGLFSLCAWKGIAK